MQAGQTPCRIWRSCACISTYRVVEFVLLLSQDHSKQELDDLKLVRVNERFRVLALGLPVPRYQGNPLDPPLRSRFQARDVNPIPFNVSIYGKVLSQLKYKSYCKQKWKKAIRVICFQQTVYFTLDSVYTVLILILFSSILQETLEVLQESAPDVRSDRYIY